MATIARVSGGKAAPKSMKMVENRGMK